MDRLDARENLETVPPECAAGFSRIVQISNPVKTIAWIPAIFHYRTNRFEPVQ
jgi:hypothetical protein